MPGRQGQKVRSNFATPGAEGGVKKTGWKTFGKIDMERKAKTATENTLIPCYKIWLLSWKQVFLKSKIH